METKTQPKTIDSPTEFRKAWDKLETMGNMSDLEDAMSQFLLIDTIATFNKMQTLVGLSVREEQMLIGMNFALKRKLKLSYETEI